MVMTMKVVVEELEGKDGVGVESDPTLKVVMDVHPGKGDLNQEEDGYGSSAHRSSNDGEQPIAGVGEEQPPMGPLLTVVMMA